MVEFLRPQKARAQEVKLVGIRKARAAAVAFLFCSSGFMPLRRFTPTMRRDKPAATCRMASLFAANPPPIHG